MNKQTLRNEIITCGRDPNYFIRKYVRIQHPTRGLIPFALFDYQETLIKDYIKHRFNVILKARQLGISETTAAFAAWLMLFHRDKNVIVMATKSETAKNVIRKVATAIKKLPSWLMMADVVTDNKLSIELSNGSRIKAIATSGDAGRSEAVSLLIIDEAAFVENMEELWTGLLPTVSAGGRVIILSTPNGVGNKFHQIYTEAESGENDFWPTRLMWWVHPERISDLEEDPNRPGFMTSTWYRNEVKTSNMSARAIAQELECNFNASGATVISSEFLDMILKGVMEPQYREHWDRGLCVWWEFQDTKKYFISADVARGDGKDYSAAVVWDVDSMEQQAEYYGKIPPEEFANLLCDLGNRYGKAPLVVENNTIGLAALEHIKLAGYESVYYSRKGDAKAGEIVNSYWGATNPDLIQGFTTSPKTRPLIISKLEEYIRNRTLIIRSKRLHEELKTFVWQAGRAEAMKNYNDDLIMAAAIGIWIRDTFLTPNATNVDISKKLLMGITTEKHTNAEIMGASKDPRFASRQAVVPFNQQNSPYKMRLADGTYLDFEWLISKG